MPSIYNLNTSQQIYRNLHEYLEIVYWNAGIGMGNSYIQRLEERIEHLEHFIPKHNRNWNSEGHGFYAVYVRRVSKASDMLSRWEQKVSLAVGV
ncbi:hypothetical protein WA1_20965 [Scytonema hofmannii PCC 7110]|uniref:Uncharacterized protein n=1 Tax=Scytonema hofmannii PCC 7110 TaxID=128403 RepID=A0A139XCL4_9CYAN|nr:hypothetical protein [Scytonema hofmannii]KYC42438.1 hypothetical protein WA1_20965 [Scytonema hofmannii PCC 7110]